MSVSPAPFLRAAAVLASMLLNLPASAQELPAGSYRMRVDVQLVLVPASVSTRDGRPVMALDRQAFSLFEDGAARELALFERSANLRLQLVLMLDSSLSAAKELPAEKAAAARFFEQVMRKQDSAALFEFSGSSRPLADFSHDVGQLVGALEGIKPRAGTALYDAIVKASAKLKDRSGRRVIVLITDGADTSSENDFHAALRAAQEAEVSLFPLVVRPIPGESGRSVRGEHAMTQLAEMTGGQVFFPAGMEELDRFFAAVNELLRTQYLLGFHPAGGGREVYHNIEVRVAGGDYVVHHRKGYYRAAPPAP